MEIDEMFARIPF